MSSILKEKALKKTVRKASFVAWILAFVSLASVISLWLLDYSKNLYWFGPGLIAAFGIVLFVLGWFLFRRQSYVAAVILFILMCFQALAYLYRTVSSFWVFGQEAQFPVGGLLIWIVLNASFCWISYKGMRAAKSLKTNQSNKISPEIFS